MTFVSTIIYFHMIIFSIPFYVLIMKIIQCTGSLMPIDSLVLWVQFCSLKAYALHIVFL